MFKAIGFTDEDLRQADRRHRQHLDRDDAVQLQPARARRTRQARRARRRRHADGVQHDRDQRRHHDGHRRDEGLARLARGDRRLDRARRPRPHVRRDRRAGGLRQDDARRGDGARAPQRPSLVLYGGSIAPGNSTDATSRSSTCTKRSARTRPARSTTRAQGDRRSRVPRRRRVRRPVHGQHDGDGDGVHRPLAVGSASPGATDPRKERRATKRA
jgi:hypothetical protein